MDSALQKVPVFILAGGYGTRLSEETQLRPKPMVEIGEIPLLIHLMRSYYARGFNDFVICAGYRSWDIKKYFLTYEMRLNHMELDHRTHQKSAPRILGENALQEKWRVRVIDTGPDSMTGARVARAFDEIFKEQAFDHFALTYGDGLTDADLAKEFQFHLQHGLTGTVLGVKNAARYGELDVSDDGSCVEGFLEKPQSRQGYINGGFFFFKSQFRRYLSGKKDLILEREPLTRLAKDKALAIYKHPGFWAAVDTLRDKNQLQQLWDSGSAPWVVSRPESTHLDQADTEEELISRPFSSSPILERGAHELL